MTEPVPIDPKVDPGTVQGVADPAAPAEVAQPEDGAGASIRSLMTLGLAAVALAFLTWMIVLHPNQQKLFGPSPAPQAVAAAHAPPHS